MKWQTFALNFSDPNTPHQDAKIMTSQEADLELEAGSFASIFVTKENATHVAETLRGVADHIEYMLKEGKLK